MKMKKRPKIYIGKWGTGKTSKAKIEVGSRDSVFFYANDIQIDDPYSVPKDTVIVIEEVDYKPDKDKILELIHAGVDLIFTSHNKKDVPKTIMDCCDVKMAGRKNYYQQKLVLYCKNNIEHKTLEANIWEIMGVYIKTKDRARFYRDLVNLSPPPMQLISWAIATFPENERLVIVSSYMNRVSEKYFYALFAYSWDGGYRKIVPPERKGDNPYNAICVKAGLKPDETYILKRLISNEAYANSLARKLSEADCKLLGIKKPKRKVARVKRKARLEDFV